MIVYTEAPDIPEVSVNKSYPKATAKLQHHANFLFSRDLSLEYVQISEILRREGIVSEKRDASLLRLN